MGNISSDKVTGTTHENDSCRNCLEHNFAAVARCGQLDSPEPIEKGFVGLWGTKSALSILVIETTTGFQGRIYNIPGKLRKYYPRRNELIMKAVRAGTSQFKGDPWAPPGKWIPSRFVTHNRNMIFYHPKSNKLRWFKSVRLHHQNLGPE